MRILTVRNSALAAVLSLLLLPLPASALPLLTWSPAPPTSIALTPGTTVIQFDVNPNGTPLSGVELRLSGLASGLQIVNIQSPDPEFLTSSGVNGANYDASFLGTFLTDRSASFTVGTVTVRGLTAGTVLELLGTSAFYDSAFLPIFIPQQDVATVVATPEPASAALLALGILALAARRRANG